MYICEISYFISSYIFTANVYFIPVTHFAVKKLKFYAILYDIIVVCNEIFLNNKMKTK